VCADQYFGGQTKKQPSLNDDGSSRRRQKGKKNAYDMNPASAEHKFGVNGAGEKSLGFGKTLQILAAVLSIFISHVLEHMFS
jgi:hypothetical protein